MVTSTGSTSGQSPSDDGGSRPRDLKEEGRQHLDSTRKAAAKQFEGVADAVDAARASLDDTQPTLAAYTANLADSIENIASRLRNSSLEELARDARGFAARNPGLFVLGSAAAGVVLARFLKTAAEDREDLERATSRSTAGDFERSAPYEPTYAPTGEDEPSPGSGSTLPH